MPVLIISLLLTIVLADYTAAPLEKVEAHLYQQLSGKHPQHFEYDSRGVPYVMYQGLVGKQYNTVSVAEYAVRIAGKGGNDTSFFNCIEWLVGQGKRLNDSSLIYLNNYDWPAYSMHSPWRSAMNQGRVMQAFLAAYGKTSDSVYLEYAGKAMRCLYTDVLHGGVTCFDSTGYWYEEYADDGAPESRVLNGMIVVLEALHEYGSTTGDPSAAYLFNLGVSALKSNLHRYNVNGHSNYDLQGRPANSWYHAFHIRQLDFLYRVTGDRLFMEYRDLWAAYKEPSYLEALLSKPTRIGIAAVASTFTGFGLLLYLGLTVYFRIKGKK